MCKKKQPVTLRDGRVVYVPCGKCEECLEHKQKEFCVRSYRAAVYYGSLHLITLSYDDETIPVVGSTCVFDGDDCITHSRPVYLDGDLRNYFIEKAPLGQYFDSKGRIHEYRKPFYAQCIKEFGEDVRMFMSYSIRKGDVQSMIKKFRIQYERKFGRLPEWKYVIIPEYGSTTARPHYHMLVFGLSTRLCRVLCLCWKKGFTQVKKVKLVNDDGSDGFAKVSAYVSKYVTKGDFEHKFVTDRLVVKPRITSSKFLGMEDQEFIRSVRDFSLGYDVFEDKYSVTEPFMAPRNFVDDSTGELVQISRYIRSKVQPTLEAIVRRMYVNINGYHYPLPHQYKNVIYRCYDPNKKRYTSSALSLAIMDYMENKLADSVQSEFESLRVDFPSEASPEAYCDIQNRNRLGDQTTNERAFSRLRRFYQKSKIK